MCGCGIGFKLIQALGQPKPNHRRFDSVFDLVSAAIAADIVPMTGENRVLALDYKSLILTQGQESKPSFTK
jgi:single-stranded-DNA-specific exonuclease